MKFAIKIFFLIALAFQVGAQNIMRFQPHSSTHAAHLGDLLLITPDKDHWSNIPLDSKPKAGEQITKAQVIQWLQSKVGLFDYVWRGKKSALITQRIITCGKDLQNKAQAALSAQLQQEDYSQIELTPTTMPKDRDIALSEWTLQLPKSYPAAKRICVRLNHRKQSIPIWFAVKAYQHVLVAQHQVKGHKEAQSSDFILIKRDIAGLKGKPLKNLSPNVWLKYTVNENQILTQNNLVNPPLVLQGQTVSVRILSPGISITTQALAQKDGYLGEQIRMKNPKTNSYFIAKITAKNQAELQS